MAAGKMLLFLMVAQVFVVVVKSCPPSKPPPCSWNTCRHEWRNDWRPSLSNGQCLTQSRSAHHIYTTHHGSGSCPGSQNCGHSSQNRPLCSCRNAYYCPLSQWTGWSGGVAQGTCDRQARTRDYQESIRFLVQSSCSGIKSSCGSRQYDYRPWCSCKYAVCTIQSWTAWKDLSSPVSNDHCASQERRRPYSLQWRYVERRDNCQDVVPQSCSADLVETREKVITCPRLPAVAHGGWDRDDCSNSAQICKSICRVTCDSRNGFQVEGPSIRTCSATGQWTTPWNTYCKDIRPPSLTCPDNIVVGNDPGKATARVTIPAAVATDNSGEAPTVTTSAGASVKDLAINATPHTVTYTARDRANNEVSCSMLVTVKDQERPRVTFCPDTIKKTTDNEIRVTWNYPTFVDNLDQYPTIVSNKNPGMSFHFGRHRVIYTAYDRANNNATCEFIVEVSPVKCSLFDAPEYGIRACNKKTQNSNGVTYEMLCNIQCKTGYAFVESDASNLYLCSTEGVWSHMKYGFPMPIHDLKQKPWPDCAVKEEVSSAAKEFTFYTGSCVGDEQAALNRIRQNFLTAVQNSPIADITLCQASQGQDCVVENVKVYCGSRSKRSGDPQQRIITFDFVINDTRPNSDKAKELIKLLKFTKGLDDLEVFMKTQFVASAQMPSLQIAAGHSSAFCPPNTVLVIPKGSGSDLERAMCVKCPVGEFQDKVSRNCTKCPLGTYQDEMGRTSCKACPKGKESVAPGATNVTLCYDQCEPGEYSHTGDEGVPTCMACPIGSYQPQALSKSCLKCPSGRTTRRIGAVALGDCQ